jgi:hypothetical protein
MDKMVKAAKYILGAFVVFIVLGIFIPSPSSNGSESEKTNSDARAQVIFTGEGDTEGTAKQPLSGNYEVSWNTYGDCVYYADLSSGNDIFSADAITSGTMYLYDLDSGDFYIEVITGPAPSCAWDITFNPIK